MSLFKGLVFGAAACVSASVAQAGFTVSVTPDSDLSMLVVGDMFSLSLATVDVPMVTPNLTGGTLSLTYDADILAYQGATFDPMWIITADQAAAGVGASGPTTIDGIAFSFLFGDTGGGAAVIGDLHFEVLSEGSTDIIFDDVLAGFVNAGGTNLDVDGFEQVTAVAPTTTVTTPMSAPAPLFLLAGLVTATAVSRRLRG